MSDVDSLTNHDYSNSEKRFKDSSHQESPESIKEELDSPDESYNEELVEREIQKLFGNQMGSAYIPQYKLLSLRDKVKNKNSRAYQRLCWEILKRTIHGLINRVNEKNLENVFRSLIKVNIIRGKGIFARSLIQAQTTSPTFTRIYAALLNSISHVFKQIGELVIVRLAILFKKSFQRNLKQTCLSACKFMAHLVNFEVAHEVIVLEMMMVLMERPTDDSIEISIALIKECGAKLLQVSSKSLNAIMDQMRNILHQYDNNERIQTMIEVLMQIYKDGFQDYPIVLDSLVLFNAEEDEDATIMITLEEATDVKEELNVFKFEETFEANDSKYESLIEQIFDEDDDSEDAENGDDEEEEKKQEEIYDFTEENMVIFRRTVYLSLQSSLDFQESTHKLLKLKIKPELQEELCYMVMDCCLQERTFKIFYGQIAERLCNLKSQYQECYQKIFRQSYSTLHRLDSIKLLLIAKFYAHLFHCDAISWHVLEVISIADPETTSANRCFVRYLFTEISEYMGIKLLNQKLNDPTLSPFFVGLFPRDDPQKTILAINFFTTIGLGPLTDSLRLHLVEIKKELEEKNAIASNAIDDLESSSLSSTSSSSSSSDSSDSSKEESSTSSSSSSSDSLQKLKKKKLKKQNSSKKERRKQIKTSQSQRKELNATNI